MTKVGPDSRRSWLVAVACFVVQVLTFGLTEASGLLFVATIKRFNVKREDASFPFTLTYCLRSAIGPAVGFLGQRFGIRKITFIGCILSPISVGACYFADDIVTFIILWGIVFGISIGLQTSLLNAIINEHFLKHRVKANGLNISGASLGTLMLSPLIEHSVEYYGLSGTFLIIAGLMLNSIPAVLIMLFNKPVQIPSLPEEKSDMSAENCKNKLSIAALDEKMYKIAEVNKLSEISKYGNPYERYTKRNSEFSIATIHPSVIINVADLRNFPANPDCKQGTYLPCVSKVWLKKLLSTSPTLRSKSFQVQTIDSFNIKTRYSSEANYVASKTVASIDGTKEITSEDKNNECENQLKSSSSALAVSVEQPSKWRLYRLFCDPIYLFLVIGSAIYYFSITAFLTIIVDYATDLGISMTYSTYLVMWIAVSDMLGYFCLGWIIERGYLSQTTFSALSFFCMCLMSTAMVWSYSFIMLLILITIFEFGQCGVIILVAPLVAELIDEDLQAPAIASVTVLSTPITIAISPLIGYFRDGEDGSYGGVFYVISFATFICCILFLCIPKLEKRRNNLRSKT